MKLIATEKAKQLINRFKGEQPKYSNEDDDNFEEEKRELYFAKRCALHCVDEILESHSSGNWKGLTWDFYWKEVKQEIMDI